MLSDLDPVYQRLLDVLSALHLHAFPGDVATALPTLSEWVILGALWLVAVWYSAWFKHHRVFNLLLLPLWQAAAIWEPLLSDLSSYDAAQLGRAGRVWLPVNVLVLAVLPGLPVVSLRLLLLVVALGLQLAGAALDWGLMAEVQALIAWVERTGLLPGQVSVAQALFSLAIVIALVRWRWQRELGHLAAAGLFIALYWVFIYPFWSLLASNVLLLLAAIYTSHRMVFLDPLTGVPNRRALELVLARLRGRFALAMLDVDHFKQINDRYGHDFGDEVLRAVAAKVSKLRGFRLFRYGGEEFCLLIRGRWVDRAQVLCERARVAVGTRPIVPRGGDRPAKKPRNRPAPHSQDGVDVTVSIGIAVADGPEDTAASVMAAADTALYQAKRKGRDRVVFTL